VKSTRRELLAAGAAAGAAAYAGVACGGGSAASDGPNVLVIMVDTLRIDHAFGPDAETPYLDELAATGLRFTRFFPEAMPTVPARNSLLSGRRQFPFTGWRDHPGLLERPGWGPLADVGSAFTSVLRRAGWWTGYVTDNPFLGFASPYEELRRSFDLFIRHGGQIGGRDAPVPEAKLGRWLHPALARSGSHERIRRYIANRDYADDERESFAATVFSSSIEALDRAAGRRPFALVVDTFEPHEPWTPPRRYTDLYGDRSYDGPEPAAPRYGRIDSWLREDEVSLVLDRMRALYAAEVTMTDRWMGKLLERLHELKLERETVIVLTSDHGIFLGERGWTGKISVALHPELTQVPLVIVDPRHRRAGEETAFLASTHDLAPTLLATAGVRTPFGMDGTDLSPLLRRESPAARTAAYGGYSNQHFVRRGRWAYMSDNAMQTPKLFDVQRDPLELTDVAAEHPDVVGELRESVREWAGGDPPSYD
jgi:arylsulfatase A-like enzyme